MGNQAVVRGLPGNKGLTVAGKRQNRITGDRIQGPVHVPFRHGVPRRRAAISHREADRTLLDDVTIVEEETGVVGAVSEVEAHLSVRHVAPCGLQSIEVVPGGRGSGVGGVAGTIDAHPTVRVGSRADPGHGQ